MRVGLCRLLAVRFEPRVDQSDLRVDGRMAHALLPGDELHQLVGALDIGRAVVERARGRSRSRQALRGGGVFLERYEIVRIGANIGASAFPSA